MRKGKAKYSSVAESPDLEESKATAPANSAAEIAAEGESPTDPLSAAQRECEELRNKNLRALADLQNYQQRAQREKQETIKYAEADFARELLLVLDDLERTLASTVDSGDNNAIAEGVRIVYDHFLKVLESRHIQPIEALGQPFNPTEHEAMMRQPSDEHAAGVVMQELARGYRMHERVLRPVRVIVSSGPAEASDGGEA